VLQALKSRLDLRKFLVETFFIFFVIFLFSYIFNPKDPLFFDSPFNIYFFLMSIMALFYGFSGGITIMLLYFIMEFLYYGKINFYDLSHFFISLFIFGEFHYFWQRRINLLEEKSNYLNERLTLLGTNYYILKLSHDELEKNYILKPYSIRNILYEIRETLKKEFSNAHEKFLMLLKKVFKIENASFYLKENDKLKPVANLGEKIELDYNDPLIEDVLNNKELVFVDVSKHTESKYLAVIPMVSLEDEIKGLLVIKEIPFFNFNKETLLTISLFLTYYINHYFFVLENKKYLHFEPEMVNEIKKLIKLYEKFNIESHIIKIAAREKDHHKIESSLRNSDILFKHKDFLIIILPFSSAISVENFINRIKKVCKFEYRTIKIQPPLDRILKEIDNE